MDFKNIINITGSFSSKSIKGDFTGGLTAAIIALPMGLAFGLQSGLGPQAWVNSQVFFLFTLFFSMLCITLICFFYAF